PRASGSEDRRIEAPHDRGSRTSRHQGGRRRVREETPGGDGEVAREIRGHGTANLEPAARPCRVADRATAPEAAREGAEDPMNTALITGISGQDGSYLAEHLLGLGYRVYGVVRREPGAMRWLAPIADQIELLYGDLR